MKNIAVKCKNVSSKRILLKQKLTYKTVWWLQSVFIAKIETKLLGQLRHH